MAGAKVAKARAYFRQGKPYFRKKNQNQALFHG
jgi:hypothetical protein